MSRELIYRNSIESLRTIRREVMKLQLKSRIAKDEKTEEYYKNKRKKVDEAISYFNNELITLLTEKINEIKK